jgi:acyl-coenzyme A thioesterase PaaI-like protein
MECLDSIDRAKPTDGKGTSVRPFSGIAAPRRLGDHAVSKLNALATLLLRSPILWGGAAAFCFFALIHGGVISAGLDAMGGLAVMAAIGARHMDEPVMQRLQRFGKLGTIDMRVDYLRPGISEYFELRAEVLRLGSRVATTRMEFLASDGKLLSTGSAAYIVS